MTAENTPDTIAPDAESSQDGEGVQRYKGHSLRNFRRQGTKKAWSGAQARNDPSLRPSYGALRASVNKARGTAKPVTGEPTA